jgi:uncharacterized protein YjiS (DUF1127 family)
MVQQHAYGKTSPGDSSWERPMQFEKWLSKGRSRLGSAARGEGITTSTRPLTGGSLQSEDSGNQTSSGGENPWRVVSLAASGLFVKFVADATEWGELTFSRFMLAVMFWTFTQAVRGCLVHARTMYPLHLSIDGSQDRSDLAWPAFSKARLAAFRRNMRWRPYRRLTMMELGAIDDRTLGDIGISRCEIDYFAKDGDCRDGFRTIHWRTSP